MQKKGMDEKSLVELTEKILKNRVDMKYYRAVIALLEKGYLLNDISAALLMGISENKLSFETTKKEQRNTKGYQKNKTVVKKEQDKNIKQDRPVKKTEKKKISNTGKKPSQSQKKRSFRPGTRKVKNESGNS